jgi:hypothetical protein
MGPAYRVEVLFIPLAVTGYVWNITKVLERCQILESKKDELNRANYMVSTYAEMCESPVSVT